MFHVEQSNKSQNFINTFRVGAEKLGFSLSEEVFDKFCRYYDELCLWDRSINLTGLRTEQERTVLLFVDSLAGLLAISEKTDARIVDIGTGGGFPGIPLKLALSSPHILLMEPRANKTAFLHNIIGKLELSRISVIQSRIEDFHSMMSDDEKCDVALCKGVNVDHILPFIDHVLKKNGKLVVFRSKNIDNHHQLKGMEVHEEIPYELPFGFGNRTLSVFTHK